MNEYVVSDQFQIAYLLSLKNQGKLKIVNQGRTGRRTWIAFAPGEVAEKAIMDFINMAAEPIQPKKLTDALREFKDILATQERGDEL